MKRPPDGQLVESFRVLLAEKLGLEFDQSRSDTLAATLEQRAADSGRSYEDYLGDLRQGGKSEWQVLAQLLTVGETYFFRHREQMTAYLEVALPARLAAARAEIRPVRVLSAGCSTGEEPYSLAMLASQIGLCPPEVTFTGLDLNPASLVRARSARYSRWSLRETPEPWREMWFKRAGNSEHVLSPTIAGAVQFREANLLTASPSVPDEFDIIFCRNVLMYFTPLQAREVASRLIRALAPGGFLFLGHAETMRGLCEEMELQSTHGCFYYRRPDGAVAGSPISSHDAQPCTNWFSKIESASERIRGLHDPISLDSKPETRNALPQNSPALPDLTRVRDLQESERYDEALDEMRRLPAEVLEQPEALLLQAILHLHSSDFQRTEALCRRLLEGANFSAGAHYLLALCREGHGEPEAAMAEHRAATRLDPGFAMPHLHLGLLARKARDLPTARKELEKAMLLLQGENSPRLRLFGGGFRREALVELCRAELVSCRGRR